jgi:hypothetical protein
VETTLLARQRQGLFVGTVVCQRPIGLEKANPTPLMQGKISSSPFAHKFENPSAATSDTSHRILGDQYR